MKNKDLKTVEVNKDRAVIFINNKKEKNLGKNKKRLIKKLKAEKKKNKELKEKLDRLNIEHNILKNTKIVLEKEIKHLRNRIVEENMYGK